MREWHGKVAIETIQRALPQTQLARLIRPTRPCPERTPIYSLAATAVRDLRTDVSAHPPISGLIKPPGTTESQQDAS